MKWGRLKLSFSILRRGLISAMMTALLAIVVTRAAQPATIVARVHESGQVIQITLKTKDIIYDPFSETIYASVPSSAGSIGNSITSINPSTGAIGSSIFIGSEPGKLAISDNGQYLYVSLDGAAAVRQFDLDSQTPGLQFSLGSDPFHGPYYVEDMEVLPGNSEAVAVSRKYLGLSPRHAGVAIYDNGVQRPTVTPGHTGSNVIEFSASASTLYGQNTETTEFGFRRMSVDASGVSVLDATQGLFFGGDIEFDGGLIYGTSGRVVNPETLTLAGTFPAVGLVEPDSTAGLTFFLTQSGSTWTLCTFEQSTFKPLGSLDIAGVLGSPSNLIRWGTDGLAFRTSSDQVFLVRTQFEFHEVYLPLVLKGFLHYCDDFSNPGSGWYVDDSGNVKYGYADGEYEILLRTANYMAAVAAPTGGLTNGSVEADIRLYQGTTGAYGLVFGLADWDHFYLFIVDPDGYYSVWRAEPTAWVHIVDWAHSAYIHTSNATNHLKVERDGSDIAVYVNDYLLTTAIDGTYVGSLYTGLYAQTWDAQPVAVRFDNFCAQTRVTTTAAGESSAIDAVETSEGRGLVPAPRR